MNYLYHRVPKNLKRRYLIPLNELKKVEPKIYAEHIKKYEGRMETLKDKIPPLNCLWNDVLHMSAVSPRKIDGVLRKLGFKKGLNEERWFKINPRLIDESKTVVTVGEGKFVRFERKKLDRYDKIRSWTLDYYKKQIKERKRIMIFYKINHILFKGKLKIKDLEVIEI